MNQTSQNVAKSLAAPFAEDCIHYKPGAVSGNRALAMPYLQARDIMDRLDAVLGVDGWKDNYEPLADGSVVCRLACLIGGSWVEKSDVGGASEQKDPGDRRKAAFSDALKRAAVKFGVGRYLGHVKAQWRDYDPKTRQFVEGKGRGTQLPKAPAAPQAGNGRPMRRVDPEGYPVG